MPLSYRGQLHGSFFSNQYCWGLSPLLNQLWYVFFYYFSRGWFGLLPILATPTTIPSLLSSRLASVSCTYLNHPNRFSFILSSLKLPLSSQGCTHLFYYLLGGCESSISTFTFWDSHCMDTFLNRPSILTHKDGLVINQNPTVERSIMANSKLVTCQQLIILNWKIKCVETFINIQSYNKHFQ